MTNLVHVAETVLLLLAAYLMGCVAGYAARRVLHAARSTRKPVVFVAAAPLPEPIVDQPAKRIRTPAARLAAAASHEPMPIPITPAPTVPSSPASKASPTVKPKRQPVDPKPVTISAPRDGQPDNLKQIKGIGPKIEASLNVMGIYHFDQIALWTKANIDWVDGQLAFKGRIRRERWVDQATALTTTKLSA